MGPFTLLRKTRPGGFLLSLILAVSLSGELAAAPSGGSEAVRADCQLDSSGAFSLTLAAKGDIGWRLALLMPSGDGDRAFVPPIAFRAGCSFGPLFLGSISLPEELSRLKDPLSRPACPMLDSRPAADCPVAIDDRELSLRASPGMQEIPGAAVDALFGLPCPDTDEKNLRVKLGIFPSGGLPRLGASAAYSSAISGREKTSLRFDADSGFLASPGGTGGASRAEESWFLDGVPPLPRDYPVLLGQAHARLTWGPVALAAGLYASESAFASLAFVGETGMKAEGGGLSALIAGRFPLQSDPTALPLLDVDGNPSGACEWAPAGVDGSWRWEADWKNETGWSAGASYEGLTGRALSRKRLRLPRREVANAHAGFAGKSRRWEGEIELSCDRRLGWTADGLAEAVNGADLSASAEFLPWGRTPARKASFSLGSKLAASMEEGRATGPGPEGIFLVILPGRMNKTKDGLTCEVEGGASFAFAEIKASIAFSGGTAPVFALRAEALLPRGAGRACLAIGPGESASLGWKNR